MCSYYLYICVGPERNVTIPLGIKNSNSYYTLSPKLNTNREKKNTKKDKYKQLSEMIL